MPAKPRKRTPKPEYVEFAQRVEDGLEEPNEPEQSEDGTSIVPAPKTSYRVHPQGRDTHCTPQVIKFAARLHAAGLSIPVLCKAMGIRPDVAMVWSARGRADLAAGIDSPFSQWWCAMEEAKGASEANLVRLVSAGAASDWKAAAFLLERRFPQRWGKPEHRLPKAVKDDLSKLSTDDLRKVANGEDISKLSRGAEVDPDADDEEPDEDELDLDLDEATEPLADDGKPPPIDVP